MQRGLLALAEAQYESLLAPAVRGGPAQCALPGLEQVAQARDKAAHLAALGDRASAEGQPAPARSYYEAALGEDQGNGAAASGLRTLDEQQPNSVQQTRDRWHQFVTDTLVPVGQLLLWVLAVGVAGYVLVLLTRVGARLPIPELPAGHLQVKVSGIVLLSLGALTAIAAAVTGLTRWLPGPAGRAWPWLLTAAGVLLVLGCLLLAWWLRSGIGLQLGVHDKAGNPDQAATAYLAGRLQELGGRSPRGFELPQQTDVTALSGQAMSALPGGTMLAAVVSLLRAGIPVAPWQATVTLIDDDQLLVIMRRNGRPTVTVPADRASLFFADSGSTSDPSNGAAYAKTIDRCGMLTCAAAIVLVEMANKHRKLRLGLTGATRWESVAGQALATHPDRDQRRSQAMLARAIDVDPENLTAEVAQAYVDGRQATDRDSRREFAERIREIAVKMKKRLAGPGYEALRLRVLFSAAAGSFNVYLDGHCAADWRQARCWTAELIEKLPEIKETRRFMGLRGRGPHDPLKDLLDYLRPAAGMLWEGVEKARLGNPPMEYPIDLEHARAIREKAQKWQPPDQPNAELSYQKACLAVWKHDYETALRDLKVAAADNGLRLWARRDPSFKQLRTSSHAEEFSRLVGDPPPKSFVALEPLASHADRLREIGIHTASDLLRMTATEAAQGRFAKDVGVPPLVVGRWRQIARLSDLKPDGPNLGELDLLLAVDVDSPAILCDLCADAEERRRLRNRLDNAAADRQVAVSDGQLSRWILLALIFAATLGPAQHGQ